MRLLDLCSRWWQSAHCLTKAASWCFHCEKDRCRLSMNWLKTGEEEISEDRRGNSSGGEKRRAYLSKWTFDFVPLASFLWSLHLLHFYSLKLNSNQNQFNSSKSIQSQVTISQPISPIHPLLFLLPHWPHSEMAQQSNSNNQQDATLDPQVDSDSDSPPIEVTSPTGIRQMVLNYLIHHCYIETAIAFANDGVHLEQNHNNTTNSSSHHASPQLSRSNSNNRQTEMEVDNLLSIHPQLPSTTATATTATTSKDRIGELSDNEIQSVKTRRGESARGQRESSWTWSRDASRAW